VSLLTPVPRQRVSDDSAAAPPLVPWRAALWPLFGISLLLGLVGMYLRIVHGHDEAGYGSYVPWGLWIAIYFHGVGIAAGAFAVSAVGFLLQAPGFRSRLSLRVATVLVAASVGPALLAVGLDLGHIGRSYRMLTDPSFTSMMALNSWLYLALLATAGAVWVLSYRPDRGWLKPALVLGIVLSIMVPSQSGAFFGVVDAKPYWHSALLPILMLTSALVAGSATLMVVRAVLGDAELAGVRDIGADARSAVSLLRYVVLVGLFVYLVLEFAEFSVAMWNPDASSPALDLVLTGPYWWVFWIVHLLLGGIVPVALLLTRRPALWVGAGALVAITMLASRLNVLIPGQAVGEIEGLQEAFWHPRLSYVYDATLMEYLVALFILALAMAVLWVGLKVSAVVESRTNRKDHTDVAA
jgi:protein NrfD